MLGIVATFPRVTSNLKVERRIRGELIFCVVRGRGFFGFFGLFGVANAVVRDRLAIEFLIRRMALGVLGFSGFSGARCLASLCGMVCIRWILLFGDYSFVCWGN